MTLFGLKHQTALYKDKIAQIVLALSPRRSQTGPRTALAPAERLNGLSSLGRALIQESAGQLEIANNFQRAHIKKLSERLSQLQAQRSHLDLLQRLLLQRKISLLCEVNSIFSTEKVLEGFSFLGSSWQEKEAEVTTALGYACLLLRGLEGFCGIRLQYPMRFVGSRSAISAGDREYPLYPTGKAPDRARMEQAIRYLVQNIRFALKSLGHASDLEAIQLLSALIEHLPNYRG